MTEEPREDRFLPAGTMVRLDGHEDGPEYGVVICCWHDDDNAFFDCYVAFFGFKIPDGEPIEKPYVLRYSASTLVVVRP